MEFRKVLALRGPNVWANFPVLEAWVDLGDLKDSASDEIPGFNERLMGWLPTLIEHRCSVGERGGFFERLRRGTYPAHILEHVTLELQALAGTEVGFGRARASAEDGVYKVVVEYEEEELARTCLDAGRELVLAAVHGRPYDVGAEVERLRKLARRVGLDPGTRAFVEAARRRNVPVLRLAPGLVQLGHGASQRRMMPGRTDQTSALAEAIAQDRPLARSLLRAAGVPVPEGRLVRDADDACAAAAEVGLPVALSLRWRALRWGDASLATPGDIRRAFALAAAESSAVVVERHTPGTEWRLLVVGDRVEAVMPARGEVEAPPPDAVHPDVAARAIEAVQAVGLDLAAVELIATDLGRPLEEQGGAVLAVGTAPDLGVFAAGRGAADPARIGDAVLDRLFAPGQTGRIPLVAVTGVNGKTTVTRLIAHLLGRSGRCVGMTCTEGIYVGGRRIEAGDCSGPQSARAVLQNPAVEAAVFETARGGILRAGLGFDRCDVAVVTNIADGDHLGLAGVETPEQLAKVKRTIVDVVPPEGTAVLKADDPLVAAMAAHCRGRVTLFAQDPDHPAMAAHRAAGGRAVFVRHRRLVLADGALEIPLVPLERVPLTHGGRIPFQVENALAGAAAGWALGLPAETIRAGLETFAAGLDTAPARFNVLEVNGATVILDYGHNVSALERLIEAIDRFPNRLRCAVYSAAGDRRDEDLVRQGELLADAFDRVVLYEEDNCIRGRKPGEIFALFRRGLAAGGRTSEVEEVQGAVRAADVAIRSARPGELILVQVDLVEQTIEMVRRYAAAGHAAREIHLDELWATPPAAVPHGEPAIAL